MDEDPTVPLAAPTTSFKDALHSKSENINLAYIQNTASSGLESDPNDEAILLTEEDKLRIYKPWQHSVIVKLFGKKLDQAYLKKKLQDMWKLSEPLTLIDLGQDYYTAKLEKLENAQRILHGGPSPETFSL
ncbi:hypothetical protein P3L10_027875 [Capsicum annuum]